MFRRRARSMPGASGRTSATPVIVTSGSFCSSSISAAPPRPAPMMATRVIRRLQQTIDGAAQLLHRIPPLLKRRALLRGQLHLDNPFDAPPAEDRRHADEQLLRPILAAAVGGAGQQP